MTHKIGNKNKLKIEPLQGPPYLFEQLEKLELCVAGSIFKMQPSKFQHLKILESCFDVKTLRAES